MPNAVYTKTVQALAQSISDRGAEALLLAALRESDFFPSDVTASQMQLVLSGPMLNRLSTVLTPERARRELRAISELLSQEYPKAPTLFTDLGTFAEWDNLNANAVSDWTGAGDLGSPVATPKESESEPVVMLDSDFDADDFEFDDPEYSTSLQERRYALGQPEGQDAVIRDLGRMQGVLGVVVTRPTGELLRVKALRDASRLGSVIAATALLFRQRGLKLLSVDLGGQIICMRPLGDYCVTVIAGPQVNIGRLLAELQQIEAQA